MVIGFGLLFVFSEKQLPDRKIRNFKKTMVKPVTVISLRLFQFELQGFEYGMFGWRIICIRFTKVVVVRTLVLYNLLQFAA